MELSYLPSALIIACFALAMLGFAQLARIQKEAIAHLHGVSWEEANRIYSRDYSDGDGARFSWREMRDYCRDTGATGRLRLWLLVVLVAFCGGIGSILLDQMLRS